MYGINNPGKLFSDELKELLIEAGFIKSQCNMSIQYNYAQYGTNIDVLSYVDGCVYWYASEALGKWFVDNPGKRLYVNFLVFAH